MSDDTTKVDALRILSLGEPLHYTLGMTFLTNLMTLVDGGDLNCISQLKILEEFMNRLEHDSDAGQATRPCEYFHSITGVGAAGVIAILLGVLGLSVVDSMDRFLRLCEEISLGEEIDPHLRSEKLVSATKVLLHEIGVSEEARFHGDLNRGEGCKVSIPYMAATNLSCCRMLRNYDSVHSSPNPTITEAIRIAWATPGLFSSVRVGPRLMQEVLISAVNSVNNPTPQAVEEAHTIFGKDRRVCCLLSLGNGKPLVRPWSASGLDVDQMIARDAEATAEQLKRRNSGLGIYFRLSMDQSVDFGTSSEAFDLRAGRVSSYTSSYLETHDASAVLDDCLRSSKQASHVTMESLYRARASGARSSRGLPPLSAFFVTRKKPMDDIIDAFRARMPSSPAIGLITGLSGTGKTQISLKYAYDHDDEYDHIIFVDASSMKSLDNGLVTRIRLIDDKLDVTNVEGAMNLLVDPKGRLTRNWLIIMDNADNSDVKLQDYIPSCDHGHVLITSRNAALSDLHPEGHVEMGAMSREEAIDALLSAAFGPKANARSEGPNLSRMGRLQSNPHTKQDEECAGKIVEELGCLPLAVIQAACYIKKQKCLHEYPDLLKTSRNKILRWPASVQRDTLKYAHSTYAAFDTTLSVLSSRALKLLGIISFVNFSDFPKALIGLAASLQFDYQQYDLLDRLPEYQLSLDLLRETFCPGGEWDPMELDALLEELQSYSLVSLVAVSTIITLRFHPLLHGWANDRLSTLDRVVFQSAAVRLLACGTNQDDDYLWPYLSSHIERFSLTADELHVNDKAAFTTILKSNRQYSKAVDIWENIHAILDSVHGERHLRTTRACLGLADAYGEHGDWQRMESMERKIVEIRKETLGEAHMETLQAMANLARTCKGHGKHLDEALNTELGVLCMLKELCGPKHHEIVQALTDLAITYQYQKRYKKSETLLAEALDMVSSLVGRAHPATIRVMQRLARCCALNNDVEEAMKLDREIIELQRAIRGDTHVETLTAMANFHSKQGQIDAAERIWRGLVDEMRETVGGHRDQILQSLDRLAYSSYERSRHAEAEWLWREVVAGRCVTLGPEHADTVDARDWVFHSVYQQGRFGEAEALGWDVITAMRRIFGENHGKTLHTLHRLAICIQKQARYAEAEVLWTEVVTGMGMTLGAGHANTMEARYWLFQSIYEQERYDEAEALGQDLTTAMQQTLGERHVETLFTLRHLAVCIYKQARYAEVEVLWREVVAGMAVTLGAEHADTMDAQYWLFQSIYEQKRYDEAEALGQDLLTTARRTLGDRHVIALSTLHVLAICLYKDARYAEAEVLCKEVIAGRCITLGSEHIDTVDVRGWLFHSIYQQQRYDEAEALGQDLIVTMRRTLGEKHPKTLITLYCLAISIHKRTRYAEAEILWREVVAGRCVTLGAEHIDTVYARNWLFHSTYEQGRYGEANALGRDLIIAMRRILGERHVETLFTLRRLAICTQKQARYAEAEPLWRDVVAEMHHTRGAQHQDTLEAQKWLGIAREESAKAIETPLLSSIFQGELADRPPENLFNSQAELLDTPLVKRMPRRKLRILWFKI